MHCILIIDQYQNNFKSWCSIMQDWIFCCSVHSLFLPGFFSSFVTHTSSNCFPCNLCLQKALSSHVLNQNNKASVIYRGYTLHIGKFCAECNKNIYRTLECRGDKPRLVVLAQVYSNNKNWMCINIVTVQHTEIHHHLHYNLCASCWCDYFENQFFSRLRKLHSPNPLLH